MTLPTKSKIIILDLDVHDRLPVIALRFRYDIELIPIVKKLENYQWSPSKKAWLVPLNESIINEIKFLFKGHCQIDDSLLEEKLKLPKRLFPNHAISLESIGKIEQYKRWLQSRRYSVNTIKTYTEALKTFLSFYHAKTIEEICNQDVIDFNNDYILKHALSTSYQNQFVNAIKLFFKQIENTSMEADLIHRPKRQKLLPNVISKEEVKQLLDSTQNMKHKAMLSITYACGLRCGEVLKLKPEHIDTKRGLLIIKQSKGRKDRIAPLSAKLIELLRIYYKAFKPKVYLFEGMTPGKPYDERSFQNALKQNILKAGIKKPVSLHWLRHSYATHLLESGTDLRYIQEILGHNSSRTTEIYTHVSRKSIQNIASPFDDL